MATFQQKKEVLKQEFFNLDINSDASLTNQEMMQALDKKILTYIGHPFDRSILDELWSKMDANHDQKVSLDEFIGILIRAEESLKSKLQNCKQTLELNYKQKRDSESKLEDLLRNEKLNNFGIMDGSQISVIILEAVNLRQNNGGTVTDPYVIVKVNSLEKQTHLAKTANPVFENELFNFPIQTGKEDIKFTICDFDKYTSNVVVGRVDLNLSNNQLGLKDQNNKDLWVDVYESNGNLSGAQLHIQIQWVYSRVKYLREVLNEFSKQISEQEQELLEYEKDLFIIYEPFMKWKLLNQQGFVEQKNQDQSQLQIYPVSYKRQANQIVLQKPYTNPLIDGNPKFNYIQIGMAFLFCLTLLIMFERAQFLDLIILMDFMILWEWNALNESRIKTIGILLGFSCKLDIVWMFVYYYNYLDQNSLTTPYEISMEKTVFIIVVISFLLKIMLTILFFLLSNQITEQMNPNIKQTHKKQIIKIDMQSDNLAQNKIYLYNGKPIVIQ